VTANYWLWSFVKPSQLILFAAVLGVVFWPWRFGRWCRGAAVVLIVAVTLLPLAGWLMKPLETRFPIPAAFDRVDGIVVLAGGELFTLSETYGQPQLGAMGDRLTTFLMLAARYPEARLVHSGSTTDSQVARALILGAGTSPDRVRFEDRSRNTCDSAAATRALMTPAPNERWLLVTSAFHLPRAVACFRAAGWQVVPYPADFQRGANPWSLEFVGNLSDLDLAAHEWLGLVYYRLRGFTHELFPAPGGD